MTSKGERYPYGGLQVKAELLPKSHDGTVVPGEVEDHWDGTYSMHHSHPSDCCSSPAPHHNGWSVCKEESL